MTDAAGLGPRATDELLLVDASGATDGSLLGGAADPALIEAARRLLAAEDGRAGVLELDIADDQAEDAGLTCGGYVNVLVQPLDDVPADLWDALAQGRPVALTTAVTGLSGSVVHRPGQPAQGSLGSAALDDLAQATAGPLLARPGHHVARAWLDGVELIVEAWHPVPQLLVVGPSALSDALVAQAGLLGWPASIARTRDEALTALSRLTADDVLVLVDHDHDAATPVLAGALAHGLGYVGALGSRHTQAERRRRLEAAGLDAEAMARYHGPTGLDLGARTPAETAVSIVAEVLAIRSGRPAAPLHTTSGRIGG